VNYTLKALPDGTAIDLCSPDTYTFKVESLAEMLSKVKRFNGYGLDVASHSVQMARILYNYTGNPHIALAGLLHDAQEAFIGDVATPVKHAVGTAWDMMEGNLQRAVMSQLCPNRKHTLAIQPLIKLVDTYLLKLEIEALIISDVYKYNDAWNFLEKMVIPINVAALCYVASDKSSDVFIREYDMYKSLIEDLDEAEFVLDTYNSFSGKHQCYVSKEKTTYPLSEIYKG